MKKLTGFRILIVDDDPELRDLVADDFSMAGGTVDTADCGTGALEKVKKNKYDFIISDVRMPNGDGPFLAAEILKIPGHKPLFFLYSGYNDITKEETIALGIAQIFNKPFKASEMIDSIIVHLKSKLSA